MKIINILKKGLQMLKISIKRYPYALLFSTITTIIMIYLVNTEGYYDNEIEDMIGRLAMTTALGFPLFLIIKSVFERKDNFKNINKVFIRITALVILVSYYFLLLQEMNMVSITRYMAVNLSLYLLFLVITYFYKKQKFELYVIKIFTRLIITFIYTFVLIAGISIIFLTLRELLNINIPNTLYLSNALFMMGIFAPIFLLAQIPGQNEDITLEEYPNIFEILLTYIIMPLISVYTLILFVYFFKIIIIQELPKNLVTHLVLWYASLSIIVLFFISPIKSKNNWNNTFIKWLPKALIPLVLMMFLAIGIRINTYGVTESRYFVVALGIWIIFVAFYHIFSKKRNNIVLPLFLAIIALLSVFGPWSSYSVSMYSQNNRFESIVYKYNMVSNNTIVKKDIEISDEDKKEIQAIIRYFNNNHEIADVRYLPQDFKTTDTNNLFGFDYHKSFDPNEMQYFLYNLSRSKKGINIKEYDYFFHISNNINEIKSNENDLIVKINKSNDEITIMRNTNVLYQKPLIPVIYEFYLQNKDISFEELNQDDFIFIEENENIKVKMIFNSINGRIEDPENKEVDLRTIDFYLLIDDKN
ncbi:MAG: DUF4153 domain-containing protein [Bacillota bacterium]